MCVCVCVCLHDNSQSNQCRKLEHLAVYENNSFKLGIGDWTKAKVMT